MSSGPMDLFLKMKLRDKRRSESYFESMKCHVIQMVTDPCNLASRVCVLAINQIVHFGIAGLAFSEVCFEKIITLVEKYKDNK